MLSKSSVEAIRPQVSITKYHGMAAEPSPVPNATPIVFVVDGDTAERESLEVLIGDAGWQPETFESAKGLLARAPRFCPELSRSRPDRLQRSRSAEAVRCRTAGHADHLRDPSRRRIDGGSSDEGGSCRVPDEAIQ